MRQRNFEPQSWRVVYRKPLKSCHTFESQPSTVQMRKKNCQTDTNSSARMLKYVSCCWEISLNFVGRILSSYTALTLLVE